MTWTPIACLLLLLEYLIISSLVGRARGVHGVEAPAVTGSPIFERWFRVQQNTLEQLFITLPAALLYAYLGHDLLAAAAAGVVIVGRALYAWGYVREPKRRSAGMFLTFLPNAFLLVAALTSALLAL